MADNPKSPSASKSKTVRSQKIALPSPTDDRNEAPNKAVLPVRSHTPGHLSTKSHSQSQDRRRKPSEASIRQRSHSQSVAAKASFIGPPPREASATPVSNSTTNGNGNGSNSSDHARLSDAQGGSSTDGGKESETRRPTAMRSTSAIAGRPGVPNGGASTSSSSSRKASLMPRARGPSIAFPPLADPRNAVDVPPAPSSGMYWSKAQSSGVPHTPLRAHTTTMVGSNVFVFGGCDSRACFNELYVLDADSFHWSSPHVAGDIPVPLRAMTCTAVGKKLIVFGGGDGPSYYNEVYILDTVNFRWQKPRIIGDKVPSARRAHTACLYKNGIYVFGGGDGVRALNDIWRLDVTDLTKLSWKLVSGPSTGSSPKDGRPKARGYHTANMVGSKLIIYGGSDGGECFNDVWVYDVDTHVWKMVNIPITFRRLSHTSTIVGSYLFVIGGHDGNEYANDVLLLNLVTMTWDRRRVYGLPPSGRGYHGTVLHDSRLLVIGGFDGAEVFSDIWTLELAVHAYYSQISHFTIEV